MISKQNKWVYFMCMIFIICNRIKYHALKIELDFPSHTIYIHLNKSFLLICLSLYINDAGFRFPRNVERLFKKIFPFIPMRFQTLLDVIIENKIYYIT